MSIEELEAMRIKILMQVQEISGRATRALAGTDAPIGGLVGFDSLNGVEVTVMLASQLKCEIGGDVNLFISENGHQALTVTQVAQRLQGLMHTIIEN